MGPVMAEPFISPLLLTMTPALSSKDHQTVLAADGLPLPNNDSRNDLFPERRLTLLDSADEEVARAGRGEAVETPTDACDGNDVQVLGTGVVGAVHHSTHGKTHGRVELGTDGTTTTSLSGHGC